MVECREHGISEAASYNSKEKFGGMTVLDAKRLKELELKRRLAESMLDNSALKDRWRDVKLALVRRACRCHG